MNHYQIVSATDPDWTREAKAAWTWSPSRALVATLRDYERLASRTGIVAYMLRRIVVLRHRFWSVVTGADIPINCKIAGGLLIPHPNGIVIHPDAKIGPNCLIFQQVTIGTTRRGSPTIGGHVDIGAGAKIVGPIKIGDHALIGANAVVVFDVPERAVVIGPMAKVMEEGGPFPIGDDSAGAITPPANSKDNP
jgi:serine O-acetyltransferase